MDFSLSEEQQLFRDAVAKFVQNEYSFEARKKIVASPPGWSAEVWAQLAAMGLLGVPFAESDGGLGGSAVDLMVVMQELGRGIIVEPYLATVVLGGGAVAIAGNAAQRAVASRPAGRRDDGPSRRFGLRAERKEGGRAQRCDRGHAGRVGAHGGRTA
jgi:alkylation response protein AidB-like acyl-CoA dehydrogenase